jgi:hypothetical protein
MAALIQGLSPIVQRQATMVTPTSKGPDQVDPTVVSGPITVRGLLAAYDGVKSDFLALIEANKGEPWSAPVVDRSTLLTRWVQRLNQAFSLMAIDTVDAQATFLAHAYVESDQFRRMTETETGRYTRDPTKANLDRKGLEALYPEGSENRSRIDPGGRGQWAYVGRGPLQVTDRHEYPATLAYLERQASAREAAGDTEGAATMRSAVKAIRADPRQAANPDYAFLFSAATMKRAGGDIKAGTVAARDKTFAGRGPESSWETGTHADPQAHLKKQGYDQALAMLEAGGTAGADLPQEIKTVLAAHESGAS